LSPPAWRWESCAAILCSIVLASSFVLAVIALELSNDSASSSPSGAQSSFTVSDEKPGCYVSVTVRGSVYDISSWRNPEDPNCGAGLSFKIRPGGEFMLAADAQTWACLAASGGDLSGGRGTTVSSITFLDGWARALADGCGPGPLLASSS
jgi:hypothetical protein